MTLLDTEPRIVVVPPDLAAVLDADDAAARAFATLSYGRQRWLARSVESARKPETRARRVERALAELGAA